MNKCLTLLLTVAVIAGVVFQAHAQPEKKTIKIAYLPITHALPLYVEDAGTAGRLKSANLELVRFGSWPELMDALNTGRVDGASVLVELAIKAKESGIDLKAVALGHRDGNVVVTSKNISALADLKGKTFAIPHRQSSHHILLYLLLRKASLTENDVKVVELPPPEMPVALAEGRIDGYIVAEPFGAKAVTAGKGRLFLKSGELWKDSVCCALVLRNDFIRKNGPEAKELVERYVEAGEFISAHPENAKDISKQYLKVEPGVLDLSLQWIAYNDLKLREKDYLALTRYMIELNLLKTPPAFKNFVDTGILTGK